MSSEFPAIVPLVLHPLTNHLTLVRRVAESVVLQLLKRISQRPGGSRTIASVLIDGREKDWSNQKRRELVTEVFAHNIDFYAANNLRILRFDFLAPFSFRIRVAQITRMITAI